MQKIILTRGLPGCGKTTYARAYCKKNPDYIRVSRDDLRNMRGEYWIPKQEDIISEMENQCVLAALRAGKHVILDATNFGERSSVRMAAIIHLYREDTGNDVKIEIKDFSHVPLETCIERDFQREGGVGKDVIMKFYNANLRKMPLAKPKYDDNLPDCIICDIDGTLAHRTWNKAGKQRSPYGWAKVGTDEVDNEIADILDRHDDEKVILMSGRDACCKQQTVEWLNKNDVIFDELYMRPEGDTRKDTVVKEELYRQHVEGKYNVLFVLDDRDCVVEMWRGLGLTCLQVGYGDF